MIRTERKVDAIPTGDRGASLIFKQQDIDWEHSHHLAIMKLDRAELMHLSGLLLMINAEDLRK